MKIPDDFDSAAATVAGATASRDPIDQAAAQVVQGQRTALRSSLYSALLSNPDMAARAQKLGRQAGLPADVVERNLPEVQRKVQLDEFDAVLKGSPTVAQWLMDQNNAKVSHDDVSNMSGIESAVRYLVSAPGAPRGGLMSDAGKDAMAGVSGLQRASAGVVGLAQAPFDLVAPLADPLVGTVLPGNPIRATAEGLAGYRQNIMAQAKANMPKPGGIVEAGVMSGFASLSTNLAALPLMMFPGGQGPALAAMTVPVGGQAYGEARDKGQGVIPSLGFGASQALIEYATEKIPVSRLIGDLKAGSSAFKTVSRQLAAEIPGEQAATILQDLNEWAVLNPEKSFQSYLAERPSAAAQTLVATLVGTGGQIAVVKGVEALAKASQDKLEVAKQAEQNSAMLDQLRKLSTASKLRERDPQTFEQFVEQATQDGPVNDVYVDAKTFAQAANDAGITLEQLPPSVKGQIDTALALGRDLRIPVSEFAAQIAPTEYAQGLMDHLKTEPLGMSRAEAKVYMETFHEKLKADVEQLIVEKANDLVFAHSMAQVKAVFHEQLTTANRFTADVNTAYANMLANFYAVTAAKAGMTPEQLLERYPLRVQAEGVQSFGVSLDTMTDEAWAEVIGVIEGPSRVDGPHESISTDDSILLRKMVTKTIKQGVKQGKTREQIVSQIESLTKGGIGNTGMNRINSLIEKALSSNYQLLNQSTLSDLTETVFKDQTENERNSGYANRFKNPVTLKDGTRLSGFTDPVQQTTFHGYDKNGERLTIRREAIDPSQIQFSKDSNRTAEKLRESLLGLQSRTLNQSGKAERDLVVTHNLTGANLLHAVKMGGIAVPSLAITKKDTPLTGFGEITLIGDEKMADPKGYAATKVFGADIYSPRYPSVEREIDRKGLLALDKQFRPMADRMGVSLPATSELQREAQRELERNPAVMGQFLRDNGIEPTIIEKQGMKPEREARLRAFGLGPFMEVSDAYSLREDPAFHQAALAELIDMYEAIGEKRTAFIEKLKTDEDAQRNMVRDTANEIANAAKLRKKPEIDRYDTQRAMEAQVKDAELGNQFQQYVAEVIEGITKSERIFQGFTYSGNRKYIPHTLENVVKLLKKELRGGEGFSYGVGSLRAQFTPQFKSVAQIRASKERLISAEEFEAVKKEIDAEFLQSVSAISPDLSLDTGINIMEEAAKKGVVSAAKGYGYEVTPEVAQQVSAFMDKLRTLPTAYFEAKILREVSLSEFKGAVVPEGTDQAVLDALAAAGVTDVRTYAKSDETDRAAKIGEFDNLFFQGNRGQIAFGQDLTQVPSVITLFKGADLSTFLHEAGHFFLEVQFDLASRVAAEAAMFGADTNTTAQQQLMADTGELLRWFGLSSIEEWYGLPMEQKRSYHEQFARGFEAYLFEGKAPSIELQSIFQRFRAWLLRIYKDHKALNVELTDEVRGVMDRMLATTEQITLAEQGRSMMPLFTAPEQAGMSVEEFAAYQDLGTQASQDAIEELQARTLRDMQWMERAKGREIKRLKRESADRRAEMTIEARREIMSQPVYRAWQFLTGKLSKDDKAAMAPEVAPKSTSGPVDASVDSLFVAIAKLGGLDRAEVQSQWGWDAKERSPQPLFGKPLLRRENGVSLDAMGELLAEYGYLPKDENGKFDARDLEDKFQAEYRGDVQFSVEYEYAKAVRGEQRPGEGTDLENLGAGRFDLVALKDIGLPEQAVQIMVDLKMTAKDGIHPDLVAESFGFTSGDELVRTLAVAEAPKVAIEQLTDQKMLEKYGELATPQAIERAAEQAIHNDTRARFVATELNALAKATGQPKVLASAARELAKTMIDRLLVRNVKPTQYAAAEVRAAKAAEQAVKSGDTETAASEKRNQLINTYATRSAINALADVEQGLRYLGKFNNEGTRKAIDVDYLDQIDTILERFDLRTGQSLRSIDRRKSLAKWMAEQEELGIEVDLPEKLTAEAFRQSYKDMTIEEFRGLVDSVKQIEHLGRLKETLLTAADNRRFADVVGEITRSVEENADGREVNNRTRDTLGNRAINFFKGVLAEHRKVASLARELDGFKDAGPVWRYLIDTMNTSGDREATMRAEATARLAEMVKPVLAQGRMGGKGQFFPSLEMSLNRSEQLAIALNLGNEGNTQRLLDGKGWTLEQVLPVMRNLTAADWQFVQQVWDFFESYRPQIGAMERRISGKEPAWVEPRPLTVQSKDGQEVKLRGGYYPIVYDPAESGRAEQFADAEAAKQMMKGAFVASTTRSSFIKGRAEKVTGRPVMLTWDALFRGANDVIHRLAWQEWVIDANRLVKNDSVDEAIRTGYGAETIKQFKNAIRDIAAGENAQVDTLSKGLNYVRSGAAVAGLGLNLMNAMLQPLGLSQSMVRVGTKWVAMGAAEWAKSPVGLVRQVHEKSEFMRNRSRTQQRELNEIRSVVQGKSEVQQKLDAMMFMPMTSLQLIADMPTWWGAYQKALAQAPVDLDAELVEERAVKLADQSVIDAQGGGQTKDLAAVQRSQLLKLFTVFYGYFSTTYNLGVERSKATNFRSPLEVMHLAWDYLLLFSVPAVLATIMKSAMTPGGEEDDPEKLAKKLASEQISYLMGMMIGVREATGFVQGITGTSQFGGGYSGPAGLRFFSDLGKLGKQVSQGELDEALRRSLVNVGGVLLHLPSGQVNKTLDGINALNEGKTDNPAALLFGVER